MQKFERLRHIRYFSNSLQNLPQPYSSADTNRLTLVHFCVQALDILGVLPDDDAGSGSGEVYINREGIIEWIYGLQTLPTLVNVNDSSSKRGDGNAGENNNETCHFIGGGFKGSTYLGPLPTNNNASSGKVESTTTTDNHSQTNQKQQQQHPYDHSHLAMTYVAICTLAALGDDLSRIDRKAILDTLSSLQKEDGSFMAVSSNNNNNDEKNSKCGLVAGVGCDEFHAGKGIHPCSCNNNASATAETGEELEEDDDCDLRFMYTAIVIWYLLAGDDNDDCKNNDDEQPDDPTEKQQQQQQQSRKTTNKKASSKYINIPAATTYILRCISHEGALGLTPGREGHGGSTFCGVASLYLMGVLDEVMAEDGGGGGDNSRQIQDEWKEYQGCLQGWKKDLMRWCVMRQYSLPPRCRNSTPTGEKADATTSNSVQNNGYLPTDDGSNPAGMQGRPNKLEDTCYSYWIGGTLHLLQNSNLIDGWALREYVLKCQSPYGGFGKVVGAMPDLLHSFYSMAWLALSREGGCCDEDYFEEKEGSNGRDGSGTDGRGGKIVNACDTREQVVESINQFSELDCALGMCAKRRDVIRRAFRSR